MNSHDDFRDFVSTHGQGLLRTAYILTGDRHRAEDLLQTVLARFAARWTKHERPASPEAYVRTALYREMCSWWRVRRNQEIPSNQFPDHSITDFADASDTRIVLAGALLRLPARQRAMLVLRFYEDRSEAETAQIMGCALGTVKSQTHKALRKLRGIVPDLAIGTAGPDSVIAAAGALPAEAWSEGATG